MIPNNALVYVQILPSAPDQYAAHALVDEAIALIRDAGVRYEVGALGTTMEGDLSQLLTLVQRIVERMIELGAPYTLGQVQVYYHPTAVASIERFTEKHRDVR